MRGARGAGPEAGSSAAEAMSGSSGGATAPAASSGPAAAASAAGSGCGGGAGEGAEEAAKDLADIAAFFRSGEYRGCPARSAGPARPDLRPGIALRALVPVAASGLCDPRRRVRLPTPPLCCGSSRAPSLAFPALAPRARLDTPRPPVSAATAPRVGAPALCLLLEGRGGGGGDGVGGGRCPGGRAHRDRGQQLCPVIAFGPLVAGPPTPLSASVPTRGSSLSSSLGVRFCETGQPSHLSPGTEDGGRAEAAVGSSHCFWGRPGKDIWDRGGPWERRGTRAGGHCVGGVDLEAVRGSLGSALASRRWPRRRLARSPAGGRGAGVLRRGRDGASRGPR